MEIAAMALLLSSAAFTPEGAIPSRYTCDGDDISPPLQWSGAPAGTKSFVLIVDDPDAPDPAAPKMTWVHWLLYNLPASTSGLPEGMRTSALPAGTREGVSDFRRTGYGGPCPPVGRHRYFFKLYALDTELPDLKQPDKRNGLVLVDARGLTGHADTWTTQLIEDDGRGPRRFDRGAKPAHERRHAGDPEAAPLVGQGVRVREEVVGLLPVDRLACRLVEARPDVGAELANRRAAVIEALAGIPGVVEVDAVERVARHADDREGARGQRRFIVTPRGRIRLEP